MSAFAFLLWGEASDDQYQTVSIKQSGGENRKALQNKPFGRKIQIKANNVIFISHSLETIT